MQTRKYPRTLEEAFGPYTSKKIEEPEAKFDWQDALILWASASIAAVLIGLWVFFPEAR